IKVGEQIDIGRRSEILDPNLVDPCGSVALQEKPKSDPFGIRRYLAFDHIVGPFDAGDRPPRHVVEETQPTSCAVNSKPDPSMSSLGPDAYGSGHPDAAA